MSGVVRSVAIRMSVNNAQAIAATRQLGDEVERTAKRAGRGSVDWRKANDVVGRGARNAFLLGAGGLALMERSIISFDKEMSRAGAAADVGQAALGQLRNAAIQAGQDTAFSATEAAQGITELAKAGVKTSDILHGGLRGSLDLAAAGQISVAEAAETASSAMTQFALKGSDVTHIADLLAAGAGKAQGGVHDLGMALNQSGLVASQTGLSLDDTVGTLTAFAKAGLTGSDAGTSFKTMLLALNPRSNEAAHLMKRLNIEAYDAQGKFIGITKYAGKLREGLKGLSDEQRARALTKIFGQDAIRAANILYRNGAAGIQKWIDKVNDTGFARRQAAKNLDNLAGDFEKFKGSLETAFIKGGSGAQKGLRDLVQDATKLVNKFNELPASVQSGVVKAVAIGTAISGATFLLSKLVKGFLAFRDIAGLSGAAKGLGAAGAGGALGGVAKGVVPVFVTNEGFGGGVPGKPGTAAPGGVPIGPQTEVAAEGAAVAAALKNVAFKVGAASALMAFGDAGNEVISPGQKSPTGSGSTIVAPDLINDQDLAQLSEADKRMLDLSESTQGVRQATDSAKGAWAAANGVLNATVNRAAAAGFTVRQYAARLRTLPRAVRTQVLTPGAINSMADVRRLARQYHLTPKQVRTLMQVSGVEPADAKIKRLRATIKSIKDRIIHMDERGAAAARDRIAALRSQIAGLHDKTVRITTFQITHNTVVGGKVRKADGGQMVAGPGQTTGARDDSIPALLSHREYVQPVASVDYYGEGFMEAVRTRSYPKPVGYAGGGSVGTGSAPWAVQRGGSQAGGGSAGNDLARAVADALRGISISGTLSTPFGPQELRGVIDGVGGERDDMAGMRIRAGATR